MRRRAALLGVTYPALGALSAANRPSRQPVESAPPAGEPIRVMAVHAVSREPVPDARVFVLGQGGRVLAQSWTDADGMASLPPLAAGARPRYVLVERGWFFIVGRDWMDGLREYFMLMTPLTPPGFRE